MILSGGKAEGGPAGPGSYHSLPNRPSPPAPLICDCGMSRRSAIPASHSHPDLHSDCQGLLDIASNAGARVEPRDENPTPAGDGRHRTGSAAITSRPPPVAPKPGLAPPPAPERAATANHIAGSRRRRRAPAACSNIGDTSFHPEAASPHPRPAAVPHQRPSRVVTCVPQTDGGAGPEHSPARVAPQDSQPAAPRRWHPSPRWRVFPSHHTRRVAAHATGWFEAITRITRPADGPSYRQPQPEPTTHLQQGSLPQVLLFLLEQPQADVDGHQRTPFPSSSQATPSLSASRSARHSGSAS